jgi:hypothetical protein
VKLPSPLLTVLLKAFAAVVAADFTGKTTITINWHQGQPKTSVTSIEEGQKIE